MGGPRSAGRSPSATASPEQGRPSEEGQQVRKHFVLDTNVLLHNPNAIFKFDEHEVVIPLMVIEELDRCLLNDEEMVHGPEAWCKLKDPFPEWLTQAQAEHAHAH